MHVAADAMQRLVTAIFAHAGCSQAEARRIGTRLTGANLRGHDSHGVIRTPRYVQWLEEGKVIADQTATIERENAVMAVVDGAWGFGQTVGEQAVDVGIAKAADQGVSVVALKNAGHLGRIGDWAERAAEKGILIEPGDVFFLADSPPRNYFRLGFSSIPVDRIESGIERLADIVNDLA